MCDPESSQYDFCIGLLRGFFIGFHFELLFSKLFIVARVLIVMLPTVCVTGRWTGVEKMPQNPQPTVHTLLGAICKSDYFSTI